MCATTDLPVSMRYWIQIDFSPQTEYRHFVILKLGPGCVSFEQRAAMMWAGNYNIKNVQILFYFICDTTADDIELKGKVLKEKHSRLYRTLVTPVMTKTRGQDESTVS